MQCVDGRFWVLANYHTIKTQSLYMHKNEMCLKQTKIFNKKKTKKNIQISWMKSSKQSSFIIFVTPTHCLYDTYALMCFYFVEWKEWMQFNK